MHIGHVLGSAGLGAVEGAIGGMFSSGISAAAGRLLQEDSERRGDITDAVRAGMFRGAALGGLQGLAGGMWVRNYYNNERNKILDREKMDLTRVPVDMDSVWNRGLLATAQGIGTARLPINMIMGGMHGYKGGDPPEPPPEALPEEKTAHPRFLSHAPTPFFR